MDDITTHHQLLLLAVLYQWAIETDCSLSREQNHLLGVRDEPQDGQELAGGLRLAREEVVQVVQLHFRLFDQP